MATFRRRTRRRLKPTLPSTGGPVPITSRWPAWQTPDEIEQFTLSSADHALVLAGRGCFPSPSVLA
jgi:hypothetical protein